MGGQVSPPLRGGRYCTRTPRPWVKCRLGRSRCRSPGKRRNRRSGSAATSRTDTGSEKSGWGRSRSARRRNGTGSTAGGPPTIPAKLPRWTKPSAPSNRPSSSGRASCVCSTSKGRSKGRARLRGGQLRVLQREPFHSLLAEIDLQACVGAGSFRVDDDALAELRVQHRLADAEPMTRRFGFAAFRRLGSPGHVIESGVPRPGREALHGLLREFVEEARGDVVAGLAVQHARLGEGEVEPRPGAGDRDVHQSAFLFQAVFLQNALLVREEEIGRAHV